MSANSRSRKAPVAIRSVADAIQDIAGTILFEAGFAKKVMDKEELVEILRILEDCKEEGRALYPEILLTTRLSDCMAPIHPKQVVICGECADRPGRFKRALKRCAAIANEPWVIVLEVSAAQLRYGIASTNVRADAESLYETVFEFASSTDDLPLIYFRRHGTRAVLIRTAKEQRVVSLTLSDELLRASDDITKFAQAATQNVRESSRVNSERVVARLVEHACREGHGFIACVVDSLDESIASCKKAFQDGAWLNPPIDLSAPTPDEQNTPAALESDSSLRARINLARKMIELDLMTMFSSNGALLGYNIHIPSPAGGEIAGGARTRAYHALKAHDFLRAVFMCSQDGQTSFKELTNATK